MFIACLYCASNISVLHALLRQLIWHWKKEVKWWDRLNWYYCPVVFLSCSIQLFSENVYILMECYGVCYTTNICLQIFRQTKGSLGEPKGTQIEKYMTFWTLRDQETLPKDYFSMTQWKKKAALNWDEAAGGNWAGKGLHGWRPPPPPTTSSHLSQIQFRTIPSSCVHKRPAECTRLFNQLLPVWNVDCLCDAQQCKGCWLSDVSE